MGKGEHGDEKEVVEAIEDVAEAIEELEGEDVDVISGEIEEEEGRVKTVDFVAEENEESGFAKMEVDIAEEMAETLQDVAEKIKELKEEDGDAGGAVEAIGDLADEVEELEEWVEDIEFI